MAWIVLFVAGLFEVGWAVGLKFTEGFTRLVPSLWTVASMVVSLGLLGLALKSLPLGTAYAIWTGVGTIGTRDRRHCFVRRIDEPCPAVQHRSDRRRHCRPQTRDGAVVARPAGRGDRRNKRFWPRISRSLCWCPPAALAT
jgi:hypothetical protein